MTDDYDPRADIMRNLGVAIAALEDGLGPAERSKAVEVLDPLFDRLQGWSVSRDFLRRLRAARAVIGTGLDPESGLAALRGLRDEAAGE